MRQLNQETSIHDVKQRQTEKNGYKNRKKRKKEKK